MDLDVDTINAQVTDLWAKRLDDGWYKEWFNDYVRESSLLIDLVGSAPSTRWGKPSPAAVEALVQGIVGHNLSLFPAQVPVHDRIKVPGLTSFEDRIMLGVGTLIIGRRRYDLTPGQNDRLIGLGEQHRARKDRYFAQTPSPEQRTALQEEVVLRHASRRPATTNEDPRQDRGGWNALGTSYIGGSGNPYDSWSP